MAELTNEAVGWVFVGRFLSINSAFKIDIKASEVFNFFLSLFWQFESYLAFKELSILPKLSNLLSKLCLNYVLLIILMSVGSIVKTPLLFLTLIIYDFPLLFLTRLATGISVILIFSIVCLYYLWLYSLF